MRRFLGRVPLPAQINARSRAVFKGYINMERAQQASNALPPGLRTLAQLRTAQLVGCPF
jgi:alkylhydroperoxidase family enzyme